MTIQHCCSFLNKWKIGCEQQWTPTSWAFIRYRWCFHQHYLAWALGLPRAYLHQGMLFPAPWLKHLCTPSSWVCYPKAGPGFSLPVSESCYSGHFTGPWRAVQETCWLRRLRKTFCQGERGGLQGLWTSLSTKKEKWYLFCMLLLLIWSNSMYSYKILNISILLFLLLFTCWVPQASSPLKNIFTPALDHNRVKGDSRVIRVTCTIGTTWDS